ncbi:MAG: NBR1-Ig-like domain-containing protein, partial [Planctomycetota bacterium]
MSNTTSVVMGVAAAAALATAGVVATAVGGDDASVVRHDLPDRLGPGDAARFTVVMKNEGATTWDGGYRLGVVDDLAGDGARFIETTGAEPNRVHLPAGTLIAPGAEHAFSFAVKAPAAERAYAVKFRMVHEGVAWFGAIAEKSVTVAAATDAATLVRFDAPDRIAPGDRARFKAVLRNTGTSTWDSAMRLGVVDDGAGAGARFLEGTGGDAIRVNLPTGVRVAPGQEQEVSFDVVAPQAERTYTVRFRMVHEGVRWFGDTAQKSIAVAKGTPPPPPAPVAEDAALVALEIPDKLPPGVRTRLKVTLKNTGNSTWAAGPYRLGVVGDGAGDACRFIEPTGAEPNRIHLPPGTAIAPGQEHAFSFDVVSPSVTRVYDLQFQMIHEGVVWFGAVARRLTEVAAGAPPPPGAPARRGRVRAVGRCLVDDDGPFNALGASVFWAAWAYKNDRPKLERALSFLSRNGYDYIRAFGQVGDPKNPGFWKDRLIEASDPTLPATLAAVTDLAYDSYGLRVEWTIFASADVIPTRALRQAFVDRFIELSKGREHKIIHFELANEYWQTGFPIPVGLDELRYLTKYLNDRTDILVAASSPDGPDAQDWLKLYGGGIADIGTVHFDRDVKKADGAWRPVRQPWEYPYVSGMPAIGSNNE